MYYMYIHNPIPTTIKIIRYRKKTTIQPEENTTLYKNEIIFSTLSSIINTTEKNNNIIIPNKIFFSLSIFLLLIILCTCLSYCIFVYIKHCLNIKKDLNRVSYTDSDDTQLTTIDKKHSSIDSIKLFRY